MASKVRFDATSRYALDEGGITASRNVQDTVRYRTHVVRAGDTVENLAHRLLGDQGRWWEFADVNPQLNGGLDILTLEPGTTIRVPS